MGSSPRTPIACWTAARSAGSNVPSARPITAPNWITERARTLRPRTLAISRSAAALASVASARNAATCASNRRSNSSGGKAPRTGSLVTMAAIASRSRASIVPSAAATSAHMATAASRKDASVSSCRRASSCARRECADSRSWFHHGSGSETARPDQVGQRSSSQRIAMLAIAGGVNDRSVRFVRGSVTSGVPRQAVGMSALSGRSAENTSVMVRSSGPVACSTHAAKAGTAGDADSPGCGGGSGATCASRCEPSSSRRCREAAVAMSSPGSTVPPGSAWADSAGTYRTTRCVPVLSSIRTSSRTFVGTGMAAPW